MRARLAPGVDPARAIAEVNELAGSKATAVRPTNAHAADRREDYVRWATQTEARLASVLRREDARGIFDNPRHRDICSMPPGNQLTTLIYAEVDEKIRDLQAAVDYLRRELERMQAGPGLPIVVDSNALLEHQRPDSVNWKALLGVEARLMLPLRAIEEINDKKYSNSDRLRSAARRLVPWIAKLFPGGDLGPVRLRDDATLELILAERPRHRPSDADEEILDVAHEVRQFIGKVQVMTGDLGMQLRAISEGLDVLVPPEERPSGST